MKIAEDLTTVEILAIAVRTEKDAATFYNNLASQIKNPIVKRKIERLALEEIEHDKTLTAEYMRMTDGEQPIVPEGFSSGIQKELDKALSAEQLIEMAMGYEKSAHEFYKEAAARSEDPRGRQVLEYLSRFEADHYRALETELRQLRENPEWFDEENDLMHVGP